MLAAVDGITWRSPLEPAAPAGYRGIDRRGLIADGADIRRGVLLTATLSGLVWTTMLAVDVASDGIAPSATLAAFTSAAAAAVAIVSGMLSIARWRLVGDALALAAGLALVVLGVSTIAVGGILSNAEAALGAPAFLRALVPGGVVAAAGCLVGALRLPQVDTTLQVRRGVVAAIATVLVSAGVVSAAPAVLEAFGPGTTTGAGRLVYASTWAALAVAFVREARRSNRAVSAWVANAMLCLGQAHLARMVALSLGPTWDVAGRLLTLLAMLIALIGVVRASQSSGRVLEARLFETLVAERAARAHHDADRAARDELDHDLRSALMALGGATTVLHRHADALAEDDRGLLVESLSTEIARMQQLVARAHERVQPFEVGPLARRVAACDKALGSQINVEVPEGLTAFGSPNQTSEILRNLLDNARLHGDSSAVRVSGAAHGGAVELAVEDDGMGVPEAIRERIFERGWTTRAQVPSSGTGLGLFVARRLAEEQGGTLTVRDRAGGGAAFVLTLPIPGVETS